MNSPRLSSSLAAGLLCVHGVLLAWAAAQHSPVSNEAGHLPAGIYIWHYGRFDLYHVNPPLVRGLAALPAVFCGANADWSRYQDKLGARHEWAIGQDFVRANDPSGGFRYFVMARWTLIPLMLVGGYVSWRWADRLYGPPCGLFALTLWCFSPNLIAWGATICPDAVAAALGVAAGYVFWRWLERPGWARALAAGLMLGIVELAKTTWIILFGLWPLLWLAWTWSRRTQLDRGALGQQARQLAAILLLGLYLINMGYTFEGSLKPLGDYTFVSRTLAGPDSLVDGGQGGNRFAASWLGALPVPLPEHYVGGIDLQKLDFEEREWSFLLGRWKHGGWWYYYLYAALIKLPLGTWVLILMALALTLSRHGPDGAEARSAPCCRAARVYSAGWRNELTLLAPAAVFFLLVSSQTGFSRFFRYVVPAFPFFFIWTSKVARAIPGGRRVVAYGGSMALAASVVGSLWIYPHSMSYFNELVGGPTGGHYHLTRANIDWQQDMWYLKEWQDQHPEARPLYLVYRDLLDPGHFGIQFESPTMRPNGDRDDPRSDGQPPDLGPRPGWYAVSVSRIHAREGHLLYFLRFRPAAMAGYSIYIYHVALDEANRVRRELGLPELREDEVGDVNSPDADRR